MNATSSHQKNQALHSAFLVSGLVTVLVFCATTYGQRQIQANTSPEVTLHKQSVADLHKQGRQLETTQSPILSSDLTSPSHMGLSRQDQGADDAMPNSVGNDPDQQSTYDSDPLGLADSLVVGPDCSPELLEAKTQGILLAMASLVSFAGYDIDPALAPVTFHLQGDEFHQYTQGMTGFWTTRDGKGHIYLFDLEKTNRSLPFTPENAIKLEDQLLPVHEAMHGWFATRIANYGIEEPFCKLTSFYISDALGETPDPITWFSSVSPYPDRLMYDLGVLGMNEAKLGQILNRTGCEVRVKGRILTVPEFAEIVTSMLGQDAVPAFVAAGLMSDETPKDVLAGIIEAVECLDPASLTNPNAGDALVNKLQATIALIEAELYQDALMKLQHDTLRKTDGCALRGQPDKDDWITTCEAQERVYPLVSRAIQLLEELI